MKKLISLIFVFSLICSTKAQENGFESTSIGSDFYRLDNVPKPFVRNIVGGTVIQVQYEGDVWEKNLDRKNAFEHACRIIEERIPTTLPLKVMVNFGKLRGNNVIAKTNIYTDSCKIRKYGPNYTLVPRSAVKWAYREYGYSAAEEKTMDFFSDIDGKITFNEDDIFSYSIDNVKEDKYDFVTVALRELCKIMGFTFTVLADNVNKTLGGERYIYLPYDKLFVSKYDSNPSSDYLYATSGNVSVDWMGWQEEPLKLYSPNVFENGRSLSFFENDESNNETRLMQADLPRGTSIRYVGKWLAYLLKELGWYHDIPTGMGGGTSADGTATSTDKVTSYESEITFDNKNYGKQAIMPNTKYAISQKSFSSYNPVVDEYVKQFDIYPFIGSDPKNDKLGWAISILRKDGTWDIAVKYPVIMYSITFSTAEIDPAKVSNYARSSDGYLRCKITRYDKDMGLPSGTPSYGYFSLARYLLLDYLPQKPQMVFSKVMLQTRAVGDEYYADIKISFKDVEGTERILVEQLEEGARVPFTYYVKNVNDGYFIASVDKEYKTTFKLRAINKNGETISEELIVPPLVKPVLIFNPAIGDKLINLDFENARKEDVAKDVTGYKIWDLNTSLTYQDGKVNDNTIDIGSLPQGLYGIQVVDEDGNAYSAKFARK